MIRALELNKVVALILCIVVPLGAFMLLPKETAAASAQNVVVVDAGHGGIDGGAVGKVTGITEAELTLTVAYLLKAELEYYAIDVVMTRTTADSLAPSDSRRFKREDMELREEIIKQASPDLVVSIHMNKYAGTSRRGAQAFFYDKDGKAFATLVQRNLDYYLNQPNLGRGFSPLYGDYYILKCTDCPSVLVECGFLSNVEDEVLLQKPYYQSALAESIALAIVYQLSQKQSPVDDC